jgi:hypothetical protein
METIVESATPVVVANSEVNSLVDSAECSNTVKNTKHHHILGLTSQNMVPEELFTPTKLSDIMDKEFQNHLTEFIKKNPEVDFVYRFDLPECKDEPYLMQGHKALSALPLDTGKGIFVGGSAALHYVVSFVKGLSTLNWKATDSDIFFLNCTENTRMTGTPGTLDFIFCKDKTIEDVLLNFDLPCCRVGFDFKYNYYVSAQALVAIFTGKMYMPDYFCNENEFMNKLNQYRMSNAPAHADSINRTIVKRFYERVKKYQSRGFKTVYTHLDYLLPWLENRFTYIDFSVSSE